MKALSFLLILFALGVRAEDINQSTPLGGHIYFFDNHSSVLCYPKASAPAQPETFPWGGLTYSATGKPSYEGHLDHAQVCYRMVG